MYLGCERYNVVLISLLLHFLVKERGSVIRRHSQDYSCLQSPYRFSFRLDNSERECEEKQMDDTSEAVSGYLATAQSNFSNVDLLDLNDLVCPDKRCAAQDLNGTTIFRDRRHLTATFVTTQKSQVSERLERLRIGPTFFQKTADTSSIRIKANKRLQ